MVWLKFLLCFIIILFGGTRAARYADIIAEKTGLGRIWIGLVLLALISSMPELVTGISAVALVKLPNLALGTILGSCTFNLLILALLDVLHRGTPILNKVSPRQIVSAGLGILLVALTAGSIFAGDRFPGLSLGWVGIPSIIISLLYFLGIWLIFRYERSRRPTPSPASSNQYSDDSARGVWWKFTLAAAAVIGAGIWLSFVGSEIAEVTRWDTSFVGSLLLAISTSMPELVICIAALRLGAVDMALADILGANMINIAKVILIDLFYTEGAVLASVSRVHLITAAVTAAMSLLVIIGIRFQQQRKTFIVISWYGPLFIGLYILNAYLLFTQGFGVG